MSVSLDEHRLGGLRWIVLAGPDRETFGALGEHVRGELAGADETWPMLARLRRHVSGPPGQGYLAAVRRATTDPGPSWFFDILTSPPPGGVRSDPGPDGQGLTTLCTLVADLTAGQAVIAARGENPVTIGLADLAEGNSRAS
jgi:hypothetical protein